MVSRLKAVAAAMVFGAGAAQAADPVAVDGTTFCERLAVPLGMHASVEEADGALPDHPVYRMSPGHAGDGVGRGEQGGEDRRGADWRNHPGRI